MNNLFIAIVFVAITLANTVSAQTSSSQPIQPVITAYLGVKNKH